MVRKLVRRRRVAPVSEAVKWAEVTCAFCQGRGKDPFHVLSPLSVCPVCHGRRKFRVVEPYKTCQACDGTGLYFNSHLYCWTCRGKGVVMVR
ncbi:MAG: hypothetical protein QMC90_03140 [Dehalococcoidales bacterium]|nr:hypothetical protein [Dehalococcoidales bacterium]